MKKPDGIHRKGEQVIEQDRAPGETVFEIRLGIEDETGTLMWASGVRESFIELAMAEDLEWRKQTAEKMLYMAQETITKALGVQLQ